MIMSTSIGQKRGCVTVGAYNEAMSFRVSTLSKGVLAVTDLLCGMIRVAPNVMDSL